MCSTKTYFTDIKKIDLIGENLSKFLNFSIYFLYEYKYWLISFKEEENRIVKKLQSSSRCPAGTIITPIRKSQFILGCARQISSVTLPHNLERISQFRNVNIRNPPCCRWIQRFYTAEARKSKEAGTSTKLLSG